MTDYELISLYSVQIPLFNTVVTVLGTLLAVTYAVVQRREMKE